MYSFACSSIERSMRLVYDFHGISFSSDELLDYISEGLTVMDSYCRNLALHCIRVSNYSAAIGKRLGLTQEEVNLLWYASIFHDIGKCNIPLKILDKPAKLTKVEYDLIKTHSSKGCEIVGKNSRIKGVSDVVLYHHERYDGNGYPTGRAGRSIPFMSRIIAVADTFDAMTSERPYRAAVPLPSALTELMNGKWTQFDGDIVDCFTGLIESKCLKPNELNIQLGL